MVYNTDTNGAIIRSSDRGATWNSTELPFRVGGNMPGRGLGERLAVDPANSDIIYLGARSGKGLWRSTDAGSTFNNVTSFTAVGNYAQNKSDITGVGTDLQGLTFVTFDETSGTTDAGATKRIFVGSANDGDVETVWVSNDAGENWDPVKGQPGNYFPHKAKLQSEEKALYLTYSNGLGPFDGTKGSVWRYDIRNSTWKDITPVPNATLAHGFGGLGLDMQQPGTLVVAALNLWWPDAQLFRSTDSGATWSTIWDWVDQAAGTLARHHSTIAPSAPWLESGFVNVPGGKHVGWMIESLEIDPLNSDHWLYGTGMSVWGGRDLTKWDKRPRENVTVQSMAYGMEETAVLDLASAPGGTELLVGVGDIDGFTYKNSSDLDTPPSIPWTNPQISTTVGVDFAGNSVEHVVRVGNSSDGSQSQIITSSDGGATWRAHLGTDNSTYGGNVAFSADGDTILWSSWNMEVYLSRNGSDFTTVPSLAPGAVIAADKRNGTVFYGASKGAFHVSTDTGTTFTQAGELGNATVVVDIAAHPVTEGEVYVSTNAGIFKSTDYGSTFSLITAGALTNTQLIALGLGPDATSWAVYAFGKGSAGTRLYASVDGGASWQDIQGDVQGFGAVNSEKGKLAGSGNVPGRVYVGTNGRGTFYGTMVVDN
ncbi:Xyloglucanase [Diaporthe eres]|uniref:Xyloglucanase n=1 Tax=Diaporthe eres TaxID=83184 RepID=A0ABR1P524_DIAER